jgi:hypothetical protein
MSYTISKTNISQILFTICAGVPYINNYELTFSVWILVMLFTIQQKYSLSFIKLLFPYIIIIAISFVSFFFNENQLYNVIRDVSYLLKPVFGMLIGYQLCKNVHVKTINTIVYTGLFIAVIHLGIIFYNAIIHKILSVNVLREYGGYFSDLEIYSIILLLFNKEFQITFSKPKIILLLIIIGFSSFLYLSRTNFIQLGLFYLTLKGYFNWNKRALILLSTFMITTIIGYAIVYNMNLSRNGKGFEAFLYKVKNAPIEAFKTKINKEDYEDFNNNYRSFENIKTVEQVSYQGWSAILFGKGLGATVDIGREMSTNDGTFVRFEAILHNAYMTVFLKSGLLGVFFLIYFMFQLMKHKKSDIPLVNQLNLMLIATGIFLIFENWVLLGIFLKTESKAVLIGFIIYYKEFIIKENKKANEIENS